MSSAPSAPSAPPSSLLAVPPSAVPGAASLVTCEGVTKRYERVRTWRELLSARPRTYVETLDGVSLDVKRGEFYGLLGPNGAGKSTLFKILAGVVTPDAGVVSVGGYDVQRDLHAVRQLLVAVLAYERTLNGRLSARENLRIFAALYRLHGAEARRRIEDVLEVVGLADTGEKIVDTFSSGMRQRLTIARALLARPSVLLLDEPTRSLDPVSAKAFRQFLRDEVAGRQGCTVLLATHSTEEAFGLCDRVGILNKGRLLAQGSSEALVRAYGDDGYRAWVRPPEGSDVAALAGSLGAADVRLVGSDEDGWRDLRFTLPGGRPRAAAVLGELVKSGIDVAHFEQSALSLADLIERVVMSEGRSR